LKETPTKELQIGDLYFIKTSQKMYLLVGIIKEKDEKLSQTVRLFWLDCESGIVYSSNYPINSALNIISRCG